MCGQKKAFLKKATYIYTPILTKNVIILVKAVRENRIANHEKHLLQALNLLTVQFFKDGVSDLKTRVTSFPPPLLQVSVFLYPAVNKIRFTAAEWKLFRFPAA